MPEIKLQTDARRKSGERDFFEGDVFVIIEKTKFSATFQFTFERFDADGDKKTIVHITEKDQPIFTPLSLSGTKGALQRMCQYSIEQAVDLMEENRTFQSTHTLSQTCSEADSEEVKKFLHDTSGRVVN